MDPQARFSISTQNMKGNGIVQVTSGRLLKRTKNANEIDYKYLDILDTLYIKQKGYSA